MRPRMPPNSPALQDRFDCTLEIDRQNELDPLKRLPERERLGIEARLGAS